MLKWLSIILDTSSVLLGRHISGGSCHPLATASHILISVKFPTGDPGNALVRLRRYNTPAHEGPDEGEHRTFTYHQFT